MTKAKRTIPESESEAVNVLIRIAPSTYAINKLPQSLHAASPLELGNWQKDILAHSIVPKRVLEFTKRTQDMMAEETGIQSSMTEDDMKQYLEQVIREVKIQKSSSNNNDKTRHHSSSS